MQITTSAYPEPANEADRLTILRNLAILDSTPSEEFDGLARLAALTCGCPIAAIALVDGDRQWFKARVGLDVEWTPRSIALCSHTIAENAPLVVPDASMDPRFRDNPLVAGPPSVRFYAGWPLSLDGEHVLGSVCVVDIVPRAPKPEQLAALRDIAAAITGLLRSHHAAALAAAARREAETRATFLRQIERMASIGGWRLDLTSHTVEWSPQVFAIHDLPPGRLPDFEEALQFYPEPDRAEVRRRIEQSARTGAPLEFEQDFVSASGIKKRVRAMAEAETGPGGQSALVGIFQDVTAEHETRRNLWRAAHLDALTGLANRGWFQQRLVAEIEGAQQGDAPLALLLIDLDAFKEVNDTFGHQAGDRVLRAAAERMKARVGPEAFCARLGGDEFAIIVPDFVSETSLRRLAEALVADLSRPILHNDDRIHVSGTIGIARLPNDAATPDALLKCADMALYRVKRTNRGRVGFYSPDIGSLFDLRRMAIELVRRAVAEERLEPYYQPMVSLRDRQPFGFEALARIRMGDGSFVGPQAFWRAFDDAESARQIDALMLARILDDLARWQRMGLSAGVMSFNVSDHFFRSEGFADLLISKVRRAGIDPSKLKLEVTETIFLGDDARAIEAVLRRLHDEGFLIALDDFGTGYASLTHLRYFPVNCLKIDKSFVQELGENINSAVIVKAIVDLAHNLSIDVVAEGIETDLQATLLVSAGCHAGQGYLFASEMTAREIEQRILPMMSATVPL